MTASIETDLPEPDSPTMASTSPLSTESETPSTARSLPAAVSNSTVRFLISSRAMVSRPLQLRVQRIAQAIAHEVDGEHGDENGQSGEGDNPPSAQDELTGLRQHRAPFRRRRLRTHAEEAERGRVQNCIRERQCRLHDQGDR